MAGHNQSASRTIGVEIDRVLSAKTGLEKPWQWITPDRAADLLADLVFVMLMLLLFVWIGLWTFVN